MVLHVHVYHKGTQIIVYHWVRPIFHHFHNVETRKNRVRKIYVVNEV